MSRNRYGGFRTRKIFSVWEERLSPSAAQVTPPTTIKDLDYTSLKGIWTLKASTQFPKKQTSGEYNLDVSGLSGLAGKFFNGTFRGASLAAGSIGTLPLTTTNDSSNVTGSSGMPSASHRFGVNLWSSIAYTTVGDTYGFIAIGYFKPPTTGTYTFFTSSDDYSGVWVGDIAAASSGRTSANAVVNNGLGLTAGQANTKVSGNISLTANTWYPIRIVHEEGSGGDNLTFSWSGPGISETTDLTTYFKAVAINGVLTGNYLGT
jgi:hypothetical protein